MKFIEPRLDEATALTKEQTAAVSEIAPRLRMLRSNRTERSSVIVFDPKKPAAPDGFTEGYVLFVENSDEYIREYEAFVAKYGRDPYIVVIDALGYAIGAHMESAAVAAEQFLAYLDGEAANWDKVDAAKSYITGKRLEQKISIVTGAAQGFGLGIAEFLAENGAYVVIADLNYELAKNSSDEINKKYGNYCSIAIKMDVSDETSVRDGINETAATFGGLDVFASNAGVLSAGPTDTLSVDKFVFVTKINYIGYFICAKQAFIMMKRQNEINPAYRMDIIQTNSKSGLQGSKRNCSYAGSKFGAIGLTQSFALEMVEYGIKVNSVCPGNFLNGPLWKDPENGLFVQYLRSGKVPGAKTVEDVEAYYNAQVPMARGCEIEDVAKAVLYLIEQRYETGQALPVTGGQVMLH